VRLMPSDAREAVAAAQWAAALGLKRAYVLDDGSAYSTGLARSFVAAAPASGIEVVGEGGYDPSKAIDLADRIARTHADLLFYAPSSSQAAVTLAKALEKDGAEVVVIASDTAIGEQFAEKVGESARAWRFIHNYAPLPEESEGAQTFTSAFQQAYGAPPSLFAANAYDLTNLVLDAIKQAGGNDRAAITRQVRSTRGHTGASGAITFDENGDRIEWSMSGYRLAGGKFVLDRLLMSTP
jgi:branched-chain amino acid transport system substrate-binding protein